MLLDGKVICLIQIYIYGIGLDEIADEIIDITGVLRGQN